MKKIGQGAEAIIYLDKDSKSKEDKVIKERISKGYRHPDIDFNLRRSRNNREAKVLDRLSEIEVNVPKLLRHDRKEFKLDIEYIDGDKIADVLEEVDYEKICFEIGKAVKVMHDNEIIHGDLTTSNMILRDGEVYFIDFGLSYFSIKYEDMAVDLHLLRQALESKHYTIWEKAFAAVVKGYDDKVVLKRLEIVEARGRNKHKG